MNEEEKKAIKYLEFLINEKCECDACKRSKEEYKTILNLIEKQQKEIEKLKVQLKSQNGISCFIHQQILNEYISKDKIREKLDYQFMLWNTPNRQKEYSQDVVDILEELLEENNNE